MDSNHFAVHLNLTQHCKSTVVSESEVTQSCPTLCDPIDGSPGSPSPGILQARTLEWVDISFSKGYS